MYTDPNDQSVWMYHRWLIGSGKSSVVTIHSGLPYGVMQVGDDREVLEREIAIIKELLAEQPDSKCTYGLIRIRLQRGLLPAHLAIQGAWSRLCITKVYCCGVI
jgi:geranylgeranyl transferase type-2 subunit alpha